MALNTILEATMLLCLGTAWPLASLRMLRARSGAGPGLVPTALIMCGYLAGMSAKWLCSLEGGGLPLIFWLCMLNAASVGFNLALQWHFGLRIATRGAVAAAR